MNFRQLLLTFTFANFLLIAYAQTGTALTDFNAERLRKQKVSMMILGGWAVGNIALGTTLASQRSGEARYFHGMNAGWNLVNLGLATAGYISATKGDPSALGLYESIDAQHRLQKIFLFNAGLDVGYMLGGAYLIERAKNTENKPERLRGFGKSIALQGAFLFVFDLGAYFWQASGNGDLQPLLEGLSFSGNGVSLRLQF